MRYMVFERKFWADILRAFALFLVGLAVSGLISAYFFPPVIAWAESQSGEVLSYELAIRFYLGGTVFLILAGYASWAFSKGQRDHKLIAAICACAFAALLFILIFDTSNPLKDEASAIRYPTAFFLFLAAVAAFLISRYFNKGEKWPSRREAVWHVLSTGLLFAAVDEVLQIHERIGSLLENTFKLAHLTTDLITVAYGITGLAVLWFILPTIAETISKQSRLFGQIYIFAFFLFGLSTFLDTFDGILLNLLQKRAAQNFSGFSDAWYIFYDPKVFANSLEEILECFAAALFFSGAVILLLSFARGENPETSSRAPMYVGAWRSRWFMLKPRDCFVALLLAMTVVIWSNSASIFSRSPLSSGAPAEIIASVKDGLFHTDDLAYHPQWGLVIANESHPSRRGAFGGPAVFVYKDGQLKKLADHKRLLGDTDSVAADEQGIYASDGAQGKILRYQNEEKGFKDFYTRADNLHTPESLDIYKDTMFILDERKKSVTEIKSGKVNIEYPRHELFVSPEGIVYHPGLQSYLITDDKSGTIFKYKFGGGVEVFAGKNIGLKNPEDILVTAAGDVIVTDNGRGEVLLFSQNGEIKKSLRFRPLFRDLQGVALDEQGNLYVVTADAHDYASFIPSFVWKIPNFLSF